MIVQPVVEPMDRFAALLGSVTVSRGEDDGDQVSGGGAKKCVGNVKLKFRRNNFQFRECSCV